MQENIKLHYWLCSAAWPISLPLGRPMRQAESTVIKAVIGLKANRHIISPPPQPQNPLTSETPSAHDLQCSVLYL